ncbi:MAG: hypothetical protein IJO79_04460, partial [Firmicutes bacterium]|nr:hypothetical protein [Bacillota bacterium]
MLESIMKGNMAGSEEAEPKEMPPLAEFEGRMECALFTDTCSLTIFEDRLSATGKMDQLQIHYSEILSLEKQDFQVCIETEEGTLAISRMGQVLEWFFEKLWAAYNNAVSNALLAEGECLGAMKGLYAAKEGENAHEGKAVFRVYEDCLCILPPNRNARRIPFCFLTRAEKKDFSFLLILTTGEQYELSRLGSGLDQLDSLVTKQLRNLQEKTAKWHKELAPDLKGMQSAAAGKLLPLGRSADWKKLMAAAPPLGSAIENALRQSRMKQTWPWFLDLCGGTGMQLGILPPPIKEKEPEQELPAAAEEGDAAEAPLKPSPILWILAPDAGEALAAVELDLGDEEAAATYLYRIDGKWEAFAAAMDRALEASRFRRDLIRLPEEALDQPKHLQEKMLIHRTPALQMLRQNFAGRAIHSSLERWKNDIRKVQVEDRKLPAFGDPPKDKSSAFCTNCGAKLFP